MGKLQSIMEMPNLNQTGNNERILIPSEDVITVFNNGHWMVSDSFLVEKSKFYIRQMFVDTGRCISLKRKETAVGDLFTYGNVLIDKDRLNTFTWYLLSSQEYKDITDFILNPNYLHTSPNGMGTIGK